MNFCVLGVTFCMFIHRLFDVIGNVKKFIFDGVLHLLGDVRSDRCPNEYPG